jgi:thiamine biosynthesis lipoprotein
MKQPNRRRFLLLSAGGLGAAASTLKPWRSWSELTVVRQTTFALGTEVAITARHRSSAAAKKAIAAAFAQLQLIESLLSIYRPDSQLSVLNRDGRLDHPHSHLVTVLRHAQQAAQQTGGAFDVTVQPLWEVFAAAAKENRLPEPAAVTVAQRFVDWRRVEINPGYVRLRCPGMKITLNGIAQGFATDRVLAVLREYGVEHALINAGELASLGQSQRGDPWRIGIQHPREPDAFIGLADLDGRALATSGDYETKFTADSRHNHILDPRTGYSPTELASVSILAPTAMQADALSTACFVLGPEKALTLLRQTPHTDAFFVLKSGETIATPRFPLITESRRA